MVFTKAEKIKISIITPVYKRQAEISTCLLSLQRSKYANREIIVIDDNSADGTDDYLRQHFPEVKLLVNKQNRGASFSRHAGAVAATGEILFFLDSDTVVAPDTLTTLAAAFEKYPQAGLVAPIIYYRSDPKRIWFAGATISLLTSQAFYRGSNEIDRGQYREGIFPNCHAPTAAAIKRQAYFAAGGFDEKRGFYMGFEEPDLAKRIEQKGYQIVFTPRAKVWHDLTVPPFKNSWQRFWRDITISFRNEKIAFTTSRNRITYMRRYAPPFNYVVFLIVFLPLSVALYFIKSLVPHRWDLWRGVWRGTLAGLKQANG